MADVTQMTCAREVRADFASGELKCPCEQRCNDDYWAVQVNTIVFLILELLLELLVLNTGMALNNIWTLSLRCRCRFGSWCCSETNRQIFYRSGWKISFIFTTWFKLTTGKKMIIFLSWTFFSKIWTSKLYKKSQSTFYGLCCQLLAVQWDFMSVFQLGFDSTVTTLF